MITGLTATHTMGAVTNRLSLGYDLAQQDNRNLRPFGFIRAPTGILSTSRFEFSTLTVDYLGSVNFELPMGIGSALSFGGQSITERRELTTAYGDNFPGPGDPDVDNAGNTLGFEDRTRVVNAGVFVSNRFDFADKYFLEVGARVDGNSAFGDDFGFQTYPKINGSYIISDEEFWNDSWGSLKLRAAWGHAGRAPGAFDAVRTFAAAGWGGVPAFLPSNVGNAEIGPETTSEIEAGFEGSFIDDRLWVDFSTYFMQTTFDALFSVRQTPSLGFTSSQLANVGELTNNGLEVGLNYSIFRNDTWSWGRRRHAVADRLRDHLAGRVARVLDRRLRLGGRGPAGAGHSRRPGVQPGRTRRPDHRAGQRLRPQPAHHHRRLPHHCWDCPTAYC